MIEELPYFERIFGQYFALQCFMMDVLADSKQAITFLQGINFFSRQIKSFLAAYLLPSLVVCRDKLDIYYSL